MQGAQGYSGDVTGGGTLAPITVSSLTAMQDAIKAYNGTGGLVLIYNGQFDFAPIRANICEQWPKEKQEIEIKDKNNITIQGTNGSAANFGIRIKGTSKNILIRNMTIGLLPGGANDGDAIGIEGGSNIWIGHNELFSANQKCPGTPDDDTTFEGLIDIKKSADNITVSYNYIHDHWKVGLDGSSDTDTAVRHITYHHNRYENVASRLPLQRFGFTHIYSNYYNGITESGINVRMGGQSLIESNYFYNAKNPITSRSSSEIGFWDLRNNNIQSSADFTQYKITWSSGSGTWKNADAWTTTKAFPALPYKYTADAPAKLDCITKATAGAGKGLKAAADVVSQCGN